MIHNLDHATSVIHNNKNFNSRVSIPASSTKHLLSIVRRLYRLFTHTYFHHREIFVEFEVKYIFGRRAPTLGFYCCCRMRCTSAHGLASLLGASR